MTAVISLRTAGAASRMVTFAFSMINRLNAGMAASKHIAMPARNFGAKKMKRWAALRN